MLKCCGEYILKGEFIMQTNLTGFITLIYFGAIIALIMYVIRLFIRCVNAIEKIADSVENYCGSKTSQPG